MVTDVSITHDRIGSSAANPQLHGTPSHPITPDAPLNEAANRKLNKHRDTYADNHSISFTACLPSSARMHGEFLRLLFLQAHREPRPTSPSSVRQRNLHNLTRISSASVITRHHFTVFQAYYQLQFFGTWRHSVTDVRTPLGSTKHLAEYSNGSSWPFPWLHQQSFCTHSRVAQGDSGEAESVGGVRGRLTQVPCLGAVYYG